MLETILKHETKNIIKPKKKRKKKIGQETTVLP